MSFLGHLRAALRLGRTRDGVSGPDDEYRLAGDKPKLVYIKSSESPDDLLSALLDQVRASDDVSYKSFTDSEELGRLVADDLAYLLSERFMAEPPGSGQSDLVWTCSSKPTSAARAQIARTDRRVPSSRERAQIGAFGAWPDWVCRPFVAINLRG